MPEKVDAPERAGTLAPGARLQKLALEPLPNPQCRDRCTPDKSLALALQLAVLNGRSARRTWQLCRL